MKIYIDGKFYDQRNAKISVFDHGFLYGDGIFEGIRAYNGRVFKLKEHIDRLFQSARSILLEVPMTHVGIMMAILETCRRNRIRNGYIRLVVTRGAGTLGLNPNRCKDPSLIIIAGKIQLYPAELYQQGMEIITVPTTRNFGLVVTDEMRVTIAAQACLLILNRRSDYFANLRQILVYPGAFIVDRVHADSAGVLQDRRHVLSGESWSQGQVILSWDDVVAGPPIADDGRNVVIHEFAHQLDQEKGHANGAPDLVDAQRYPRWSRVLGQEYGLLQERIANQEATLLDPYAATDPAEFFAGSSEVFFEQPHQLAAHHPELYGELSRYYRIDPRSW